MNSSSSPAGDTESFSVYHLDAQSAGATLAAALKGLVPSASWGQVKRWIGGRRVEINGNLCIDEARRVGQGDVIKLWKRPLPKPVEVDDLRLVFLDEHLLVVDKPAGVTSVRHAEERGLSSRRRQLQPTLEELLPPVLAKVQRLRWPPLPPPGQNRGTQQSKQRMAKGSPLPIQQAHRLPPLLQVWPVHRLDRHTSGLMLFARSRAVQQQLIGMFREHQVRREYVGVCHGVIQPQTIRSMLVRDRGDGLRGSLAQQPTPEQLESAQAAVTHVLAAQPIGAGKYSLIRCRLETGRTHQIRIHLSEAGHRLCGEPLYVVDATGQKLTDDSGAPRQALHSDRLMLTHPVSGQPLTFQIPWPPDLARWVRPLRAQQA